MRPELLASPASPKSVVKRIVAVSLLAASVVLLAVGLHGDEGSPAKRDFIAYWSAGQILARHGNPYSDAAILSLEKHQGFKEAEVLPMLNPPWALVLVLPLGYVSAYVGSLAWILAVVVCIMISLRLLKRINGGRSQDHLLAYAFSPVLACIMGGQMSGFACLALVGFLYLRKGRPFAAGLAASFLTVKPHLFILFFIVLFLDSLWKRDGRSIIGVAVGFISSLCIPMLFNHNLLSQYLVQGHLSQIEQSFIPTVSFILRLLVNRNAFWIQFLPECIAAVWAIWFYVRNSDQWDWNRHGLVLLLVSLWVAPYSTFLDELVLLPAVVSGIYFTDKRGVPNRGTLTLFLLLNGVAFTLLFAGVPPLSGAYIWTTTAWLLWYIYAVHEPGRAYSWHSRQPA